MSPLFMFTLYKRINDTIYAACGGGIGASTAIFNSKLMVGFFPGGYRGEVEDECVWWAGCVWGPAPCST